MPPGKHALITVKQPKGNLVWIQTPAVASTAAKKNDKDKSPLHINTWNECDALQVNDTNTIEKGRDCRDFHTFFFSILFFFIFSVLVLEKYRERRIFCSEHTDYILVSNSLAQGHLRYGFRLAVVVLDNIIALILLWLAAK